MSELIAIGAVLVVAGVVLMRVAARPERQEKRMRMDPDREPSLFGVEEPETLVYPQCEANERGLNVAIVCDTGQIEQFGREWHEVFRQMSDRIVINCLLWPARDCLPVEGSDLED